MGPEKRSNGPAFERLGNQDLETNFGFLVEKADPAGDGLCARPRNEGPYPLGSKRASVVISNTSGSHLGHRPGNACDCICGDERHELADRRWIDGTESFQ